jgi:hypothetical protein
MVEMAALTAALMAAMEAEPSAEMLIVVATWRPV